MMRVEIELSTPSMEDKVLAVAGILAEALATHDLDGVVVHRLNVEEADA